MKKSINILLFLFITINAFANNDSLNIQKSISVSYDLPPAPHGNWLYASLIESKTYQEVCKKAFTYKCFDVIASISVSTQDLSEIAKRKYALDIINSKQEALTRAIQKVTSNQYFGNIEDQQTVYDNIVNAFNDNFDSLSLSNY